MVNVIVGVDAFCKKSHDERDAFAFEKIGLASICPVHSHRTRSTSQAGQMNPDFK